MMDLDAFYNGRLPLLSQFTGGAKVSFTPSYFDLSSARWVPLCRPWGTRIEVLRQRRHAQQTPSFAPSLSPSLPHSQPLLDAGSSGESKRGEWGAGSGGGILEEEESIKVKVEADEPLLITLTDIVLHHVAPGLQAWVTAATTTAREAGGVYDPQHASNGTEDEGRERGMQPPLVVSSLEPVEKAEAPIVFCNELGVGASVWRHLPHRHDGMHAGRHGEERGNIRTQSDGSSSIGRGERGSADGTHPAAPPAAPPAVSWVPGYGILPVSFKDQHLLQSSNGSSDGPNGTRERDALSGFRVRRVYGQDADDAPNVLAVLVEGAMEVRWGDEREMRVVWREIISLDITWSAVNDTHISFPPIPSVSSVLVSSLPPIIILISPYPPYLLTSLPHYLLTSLRWLRSVRHGLDVQCCLSTPLASTTCCTTRITSALPLPSVHRRLRCLHCPPLPQVLRHWGQPLPAFPHHRPRNLSRWSSTITSQKGPW